MRWLGIHSVGAGPDICVIYCHTGQVYEWQQRYDQWCDRINQFPKGNWQGLEEGFIITDFIDVLQTCVCVCVCVSVCAAAGMVGGHRDRGIKKKSAKCTKKNVWMCLCLHQLLLCACCSAPVLLLSVFGRQHWQQVLVACFTLRRSARRDLKQQWRAV